MTEPDCLGPLDPGTTVSLEGIVWNETDGKWWCILSSWLYMVHMCTSIMYIYATTK